MHFLRQIVTVLALAVASSGSLPLVVHHLQCHQSHLPSGVADCADARGTVARPFAKLASCSCAHGSISVAEPASSGHDSELASASAADEDCSVCFQLSQVTSVAEYFGADSCVRLAGMLVLPELNVDLATVAGNNPPRGPPAV